MIGAGFAGYTASLYSVRYGFKVLVIGAEPGGAIVKAQEVCNYPGFEKMDEALFYKYLAHSDEGQDSEAQSVLTRMKREFPESKFTILLTNPDYYKNNTDDVTALHMATIEKLEEINPEISKTYIIGAICAAIVVLGKRCKKNRCISRTCLQRYHLAR